MEPGRLGNASDNRIKPIALLQTPCWRNVLPPLKRDRVALIVPHVGHLSHINLTPNFHTCVSNSREVQRIPTRTLTRKRTRGAESVGFGDGGHHRPGQDQWSRWACSAYLHPMLQYNVFLPSGPHLSSPSLNSSRPPTRTSEKQKRRTHLPKSTQCGCETR